MVGDGVGKEKLRKLAEQKLKRVAKLAMYHLEHMNYSIEMRWSNDAVTMVITVKIQE